MITKEKKAALDVGDAIDKMKETKDLTLADRANVMKAKAAKHRPEKYASNKPGY